MVNLAPPRAASSWRGWPPWLVDGERGLWRYLVAALLVAAGVIVAEWLLLSLHVSRISLVLLVSVVLTATWFGARPAVFAALASFVCYRQILLQPPMHTRMEPSEELITLVLFLTIALSMGAIAGRMRDAGRRSAALAARNRALFLASRGMSAVDSEEELRRIILHHVSALACAPARWREGGAEAPEGWSCAGLASDGEEFGAILWQPATPLTEVDRHDLETAVELLASLGAASIARARLASERARLESLERTERLQAALLSSVSHDFRTPLSAIMTSASSLRQFGETFDAPTRQDLATTIQEEAERLNRFVAKLLHMTRLEAGALRPDIAPFDVVETVGAVSRRLQPSASSTSITVNASAGELWAQGDHLLFEHALSNVLENALRFSEGAPVVVTASRQDREVEVTVTDAGRGVASNELDLIFNRFYRASNTVQSPAGAGIGLSITRGLVAAMGGSVAAGPGPGGAGLAVRLALPASSA